MQRRGAIATAVTAVRKYRATAAIIKLGKMSPARPSWSSSSSPPPPPPSSSSWRKETLSKKILSLVDPKDSAVDTICEWKDQGHSVGKCYLNRIVRELRRLNRFKHALQICEWMTKQQDIKLFSGDYAIHLDLIAKLRGLNAAEQFFLDMPHQMRSQPTLSSLLHTFVQHRAYEKAEALMDKMSQCHYLNSPLPYNHMITMYLQNGKLHKIPNLIQELKTTTTPDIVSYNLWLTACLSQNDVKTAENVFLEMKTTKIEPDWITYSILTSLYVKEELNDRAKSTLMEMEKRVSKKHRASYASLITLHTNLGDKEGVDRIWKDMKSLYHKLNDAEYTCMIASLIKLGEIESAEKIYSEWESISPTGDSRVSNLLIGDYIKRNQIEKAKTFFQRAVKKGIKPSYTTWELLTRGYLKSNEADLVLYYFEKAICSVKKWEPNIAFVREIYQLLEERQDIKGAEKLLSVLRNAGYVTTEIYNLHLRTYAKAEKMPPVIEERMEKDGVLPDSESRELVKLISKMCVSDAASSCL